MKLDIEEVMKRLEKEQREKPFCTTAAIAGSVKTKKATKERNRRVKK